MFNSSPVPLVSIHEIARRAKACSMTLRRHIAARGIQPDAIIVTTGNKPPAQLFVESRAQQIAKLISTGNIIVA
jgi:hypothetical protein